MLTRERKDTRQTVMGKSTTADTQKNGNDTKRLQVLYAINDLLTNTKAERLDINEALPHILQVITKHLDTSTGSIIVIDEQQNIRHSCLKNRFDQRKDDPELFDGILDNGLAGWVMQNRTPAIVHDTVTDERWLKRPRYKSSHTSYSALSTPLLIHNQSIGAITILKDGQRKFTDSDLTLLVAIASQATHIIQNAKLFEESKRQLEVLSVLSEASAVINSSLDLNEIMQQILWRMNDLLNAEAISIALVDQITNELVYQIATGIGSDKIIGLRLPPNQGLSGWVMKNAEPALVNEPSKDSRFKQRIGESRTGFKTHAMICAPIKFKNKVLGTIQAINPIDGAFSQTDLSLLKSIANIASSAIANAQQHARTQAAEERYMNLFQDSIDPIVLTDLNGQIVEGNHCAFNFFGYGGDVFRLKQLETLHIQPSNFPTLKLIKDEVLVFTSQVNTISLKETLHVEVSVKQIAYGKTELLQWIYNDITKQVELEEMRQDLTAMLVHDLQSPLGNVISSLELIKSEVPENSNRAVLAMLDIATRSSNHLQTLIASLLDISRLEAGHPVTKFSSTSILDLLEDVYDIQQPHFTKRHITYHVKTEQNLPNIYAEIGMIRRVLLNLLDNAIKYSLNGQHITVKARQLATDNKLLISVCDEGGGIPVQYRQLVFEKFQRIQSKTNSNGLGLGLAFCRLAVEAHGGEIWVDDAPEGGARFNFTVPVG